MAIEDQNTLPPRPAPGPSKECACPPGQMATSGIDPRTGCPPCITPPTDEYGGYAPSATGKPGPGAPYGGRGKRRMTPRSRISDKNTQQETY